MKLALEYLRRYVYRVSKDYRMEDPNIIAIENYIYFDSNFHVSNSGLCLAKSVLMDRVARRNFLKNPLLSRKC
mgnify:CR=1 FL=1